MGQLQRLAAAVCIILAVTSVAHAVLCYECERCEKHWSPEDWQTVDCGNGTCGKRVASGFTADVVPFKSTNRFCELEPEDGALMMMMDGCRKRTLSERVNGWLVKMSSIEECVCATDYCNAAPHVAPGASTLRLITAATGGTLLCVYFGHAA